MKSSEVIFYLIAIILLTTINISAQDGTLDPTFGDGGIVETNIKIDMLIQQKLLTDNKMLILARQDTAFVLIKINEDGSFDDSFGTNGKVNFESGEDSTDYSCSKFDVTEDGKILLLENRKKLRFTYVPGGSDIYYEKVTNSLIRLNSNGGYDSEFGENGVLNIYSFESDSLLSIEKIPFLFDINVRPNNTVLIMGYNSTEGVFGTGTDHYELLRLNYDGSYDSTFGVAGILSITANASYHYLHNKFLKVDHDENIYFISYHNDTGIRIIKIKKYFQNGVRDDNYGNSGNFTIDDDDDYFGEYTTSLFIKGLDIDLNNNLLCVVGLDWDGTDKSVIIRITPDGILDPTFGENGIRKIILSEFGSDKENASRAIFSMVDGNIVWGGFEKDLGFNVQRLLLAKLNNNGSANTSFADNGMVFNDYFYDSSERWDNDIQGFDADYEFVVRPDNQDIVIATSKNDTLYFARYLNSRTYSSIHVSGEVYGNWGNIDTVYVDGDLTIPLGETLTINEGTNVYFTGKYKIDVYGQITAEGTESFPITFDSPADLPWRGINFLRTDDNYQPNSRFDYCEFTNSKAYWNDGLGPYYGVLNFNHSKVYVDNSFFHHTTGIYFNNSSSELTNTNFLTVPSMRIDSSSTALISYCNFDSSGVSIYNSSPIINNCIIERSSNGGGVSGIYGNNANPNISYTIIRNNSGGVYFENSSPIFDHVTIENNSANGYGGGGYFSKSFPTFTNVIIKGNTASLDGAGLMFSSVNTEPTLYTATFNNCLIVKNTVTNTNSGSGAGAKFLGNTNGEFTNCTIADNVAHSWAGISGDGGEDSHLNNCIVYNNGNDLDFQAGGLYTYSIIQGNYVGSDTATTNFQNIDPLFRDAINGDYHLQSIACGYSAASPAIDAGDPNIGDYVLDCETAGLGTTKSDIGAYGGADNWWDKTTLPVCHFAGEVSGSWDCEDIYVDGNILIPEGDTLQISETVNSVHITGPYQIKVEGVLLAIGPENNGVETDLNGNFINFQGSKLEGEEWKGIYFNNLNNTNPGNSIIENCRFDYADKMDMTYQGGGAIAIYNSDKVEVKHSVFYANNAKFGGAMYIENSSPHIEDCYFELNGKEIGQDTAITTAGGAIYVKDANPYLHKLRIVDNRSTGGGGAIALDNSSPVISNVLFAKNKTNGLGGAVHCFNGSSPKFVNITSADNIAETAGGTFYLNPNSNPEIINSIMFGNTKPEIYLGGGTPIVTYSIIDSGATESFFGTGCLDTDPKFEMTTGNYYYLSSTACGYSLNSDAIDAGHPDSLDAVLDCEEGLGTQRADMGYYGGRYSDMPVGVKDEIETQIPNKYELAQNYPNPFNPSTTIQFAIPKAGMVSLKVYNILGEEVATLINREMNAGFQSVNFDASNLSSGLYFYRISASNFLDVKKMLLLK